ncbi:nucleotidyltransferase domain protein [bacterium BMS3Bbin05]|nr:nucleotidyltransferase domain protein [bacterium BMS3Bbin05]
MDIESIKNIVAQWADSEPLVTKAYIFGSRAIGDYRKDSDLDVAIEIEMEPGDESKLATWLCEKQGLEESLSRLIPYDLQLEYLNGDETPNVLSGVERESRPGKTGQWHK